MAYFKLELLTFAENTSDINRDVNFNRAHYLLSPISEFDSDKTRLSFCYTYDESLSLHQNAQKELSFKFNENIFYHDEWIKNPYLKTIVVGAQLMLTDKDKNQYLFTVKSLKSEFKSLNTVYTVTCQDSFSYQGSRQNKGYSIENDSTSEDFIGAKTLDWWAKKICNECKVIYQYLPLQQGLYLDEYNHNQTFTSEEALSQINIAKIIKPLYSSVLYPELFTTFPFSTSSSPVTSVLISAAENVGMQIETYEQALEDKETHLTYIYRYFWFKPLKDNINGISGYQYDPRRDIQDFNLSFSGDNLTSILNVEGKTNSDEELISLLPQLTPFFANVFSSNFWRNSQYYPGFYEQLCHGYTFVINTKNKQDYFIDSSQDYQGGQIFWLNKQAFRGILDDLVSSYDMISFSQGNSIFSRVTLESGRESISNWSDWRIVVQTIEKQEDSKETTSELFYRFNESLPVQTIWGGNSDTTTIGIYIPEADTPISSCQIYLYLYREATQEDLAFARIADACPWLENKIMSFDYFKNKGIISKSQLQAVKNTVTNELRKINSTLLLYSNEYYSAIHKKTKIVADLLSKLDSLGAAAESDFITPYATTGSLGTTMNNHSYFDAAYKILFRTNSDVESQQQDSLADYDSLVTQYNTLYFNSKQRFLKNLYNFRQYFMSQNTRFAGRTIRVLDIDFNREAIIDSDGTTNWIGFSNSSNNGVIGTMTTATKQNIMLDESGTPNLNLYKKNDNKYEKLTVVDKKNVSQFYQLSDIQKGLKQITSANNNLTYQKDATYWAYIRNGKYDEWLTKDTPDVAAHQVLPIAYVSSQDYGIGDRWNSQHIRDIYQRDKVNTYTSVNEFLDNDKLCERIKNLYSPRLFGNYSNLANKVKNAAEIENELPTWNKIDDKDIVNSYVWNLPITNLYYHTADSTAYRQLPWLTLDNYDSYYKYTSNSTAEGWSIAGAVVGITASAVFLAAVSFIPVAGVVVGSVYLAGAAASIATAKIYGQQTLNLIGTNKQTLDGYTSAATDTYNPYLQSNIYCITDKDKIDSVRTACSDEVKDTYQDVLQYLVPGYTTFNKNTGVAWGKIGNKILDNKDNIYFKDKWMRAIDLKQEKINSQDKYYIMILGVENTNKDDNRSVLQLIQQGGVFSPSLEDLDKIPDYFSQILDYPLMSAVTQIEFNSALIKKYNGDAIKIMTKEYPILSHIYGKIFCGYVNLVGYDQNSGKKVDLYYNEETHQLTQDGTKGYHEQAQYFMILREENYKRIEAITNIYPGSFKPGLDFYDIDTNKKIDYTKVGSDALVGLYQLAEVPDNTSATATWDDSQATSYWTKTIDNKFEQVYTAQQLLNNKAPFNVYVFNNYHYATKQFFEGDDATLEFSVPAICYSTTIKKDGDNVISSISNQQQVSTTNIGLVLTYDKGADYYLLAEKDNPSNKVAISPGDPEGVKNSFIITRTVNNITYTSTFICHITAEKDSEQVPYMTNGELWYKYHTAYDDATASDTKEYLRPLFEYAAAIETQLESYWTSAYAASKYCDYFLPEHWQPWSDKEKNYFFPSIISVGTNGLQLNETFVPKVNIISVNGITNLPSYQMTYYSNLQEYYDSIAGGDYSGKLINDEDTITDNCDKATTTNAAYREQADFFNEVSGNDYFKNHFVLVKNGTASYYVAASGGCTWQNLISMLIPAEAQIYNNFSGIYPMLLRVFLTQYKNNSLYNYKKYLQEHDLLWQRLYNSYPGIMLENTYSNEDATTSEELYTFANNYFKQYCQPERNYDVSVIDILNLKGYDSTKPLLQIGSAIQLDPNDYEQDPDSDVYNGLKQYLFISDISYTLRKDNDIKLTVNDIKYEDKLIKSLAKLIK